VRTHRFYFILQISDSGCQSLVLAWVPRADGVFLGDIPQRLVQQGKAASIPFVSGILLRTLRRGNPDSVFASQGIVTMKGLFSL